MVDVDSHGARLDPPLDLALPLRQEARRADDQGRLRLDESLGEWINEFEGQSLNDTR